jgi:hypothetical protein
MWATDALDQDAGSQLAIKLSSTRHPKAQAIYLQLGGLGAVGVVDPIVDWLLGCVKASEHVWAFDRSAFFVG